MSTLPRFIPLLVIVLCDAACTRPTVPLSNPPPLAVAHADLEVVRGAILGALTEKGWGVAQESEGRLVARLQRRSHTLLVEIDYRRDISISYLDSENLKYEEHSGIRYIHPQYNRWTRMLALRIEQRLRELSRGGGAPPTTH